MGEDMSDLMNQIKKMMDDGKIPDNIMEMANSFKKDSSSAEKQTSSESATSSPSISPEMIGTLMNALGNQSKNSSNENDSQSDSATNSIPNIDFETILKLKSVMEKMNSKDDPRSKLLLSLKPYLKESRKEKVDQYINLFNMGKIIDIFGMAGGDKKK